MSATVASDFNGYFAITDTTDVYPPALVFINAAAMAESPTVALPSVKDEAALATDVGVALDPAAASFQITGRGSEMLGYTVVGDDSSPRLLTVPV